MSALLHRTVAEIATYCNTRDFYMRKGLNWEAASLVAYDKLFIDRKAKAGGYIL